MRAKIVSYVEVPVGAYPGHYIQYRHNIKSSACYNEAQLVIIVFL